MKLEIRFMTPATEVNSLSLLYQQCSVTMSKRNYWNDCENGEPNYSGKKMDRLLLCRPKISHVLSCLCVYYSNTHNCTKPNVCFISGKPFAPEFPIWFSTEPDNAPPGEYCVTFHIEGRTRDVPCFYLLPFFCEKDIPVVI